MAEKKISLVMKIIVSIAVLVLNGYLIYLPAHYVIGLDLPDVLFSSLLNIFAQILVFVLVWAALSVAVVGLFVIQPAYFFVSKVFKSKFDSDKRDKIKHHIFLFTCKLVGGCSILLLILWTLAFMNE